MPAIEIPRCTCYVIKNPLYIKRHSHYLFHCFLHPVTARSQATHALEEQQPSDGIADNKTVGGSESPKPEPKKDLSNVREPPRLQLFSFGAGMCSTHWLETHMCSLAAYPMIEWSRDYGSPCGDCLLSLVCLSGFSIREVR